MRQRSEYRYRDDEALLFGVFRSLARKTGINVWVLRVVAILIACHIGFIPSVILYLIGAILIPNF
jgi:phage shock protein PspC (stress-responsive transcriptional regulator)